MAVTKDEILDTISKMSVMEVVELIADMEKKFNVTAAAPVAAAASGGGGAAEAKDLVEGAPSPVKEGIPKADADAIKTKLEAAGAKAAIK